MIRTFLRASGRTEQEERLDWTEVGCLVAVPGPGPRRAGTADPFECMELVLCKVGLIITCVVPHPCGLYISHVPNGGEEKTPQIFKDIRYRQQNLIYREENKNKMFLKIKKRRRISISKSPKLRGEREI